jgi:cytidylate kinase
MQALCVDLGDPEVLGARLQPRVVAVDGPAGSGKSTVGHRVAEALGYLHFDTGAMYRAITWAALAAGVDVDDLEAVSALAERCVIDVLPPAAGSGAGSSNVVRVDEQDVTTMLRLPVVDQKVSIVSAYPRVRAALSRQQRRIGERYGAGHAEKAGVVMVGRDIGTVIMPDAPLKVYVDASVETRARRRFLELQARDGSADYDQVLADLIRRDALDSGRAHSPLQVAADAIVIDTSEMGVTEVVCAVLALVKNTVERLKGEHDGRG